MNNELTAGTAAAGYLVTKPPHPFRPAPADPGERPHCLDCPLEKSQHIPVPRGGTR